MEEEGQDLKALSLGIALRLTGWIMLRLWQGVAYRHSIDEKHLLVLMPGGSWACHSCARVLLFGCHGKL